jgi:8-oxo-dGTP pyrophosphatase MutT (NUDIX family)
MPGAVEQRPASASVPNRTPPGIGRLIDAFLAGDTTATTPRDSATVVLLRDGPGGVEVYLLRRSVMVAYGGRYVFPGGLVDPADAARGLPWAGPSPREWATALDCDEVTAQALVCAAVRETFEECGVLLAGPSATEVIGAASGPDWDADRSALLDHSLPFSAFLLRRSLVVRSDLLRGLARWITPEWASRRYDTRFFVAEVPPGQSPRDIGLESDSDVWLPVSDALRGYADGSLSLMLPTVTVLRDIADAPTAHAALDAPRDLSPTTFRVVQEDGRVHVVTSSRGRETYAYPVRGDDGEQQQ